MLIWVAFWSLEYTSHPEISRSPIKVQCIIQNFCHPANFHHWLEYLIKIHFVSLHNFSFLSSIIRPKLTKCLVIDPNDWHSGLSFVLIIQGSSLLTFFFATKFSSDLDKQEPSYSGIDSLACLEIRSRNEKAINSTWNSIYSLKVFYFLLCRRWYFLFVSELIQYAC